MILCMELNVGKISAQKTILEDRHKDCEKGCLKIMLEMLNLIGYVIKNFSKYHKYPKIEDLTLV